MKADYAWEPYKYEGKWKAQFFHNASNPCLCAKTIVMGNNPPMTHYPCNVCFPVGTLRRLNAMQMQKVRTTRIRYTYSPTTNKMAYIFDEEPYFPSFKGVKVRLK